MKTNADLELERIIYERDIQRTHWLIKAYHRTRIQKLEKNAQYYLHHKEYTRRLSSAELDYVKNYFVSIGRYVPVLVLLQEILQRCSEQNVGRFVGMPLYSFLTTSHNRTSLSSSHLP